MSLNYEASSEPLHISSGVLRSDPGSPEWMHLGHRALAGSAKSFRATMRRPAKLGVVKTERSYPHPSGVWWRLRVWEGSPYQPESAVLPTEQVECFDQIKAAPSGGTLANVPYLLFFFSSSLLSNLELSDTNVYEP